LEQDRRRGKRVNDQTSGHTFAKRTNFGRSSKKVVTEGGPKTKKQHLKK